MSLTIPLRLSFGGFFIYIAYIILSGQQLMTESFLKYLRYEKRVSAHTLQAYQNDLLQFAQFLQDTFPDQKPESAGHNEIRSWIISLNTEKKLEPASINRKIASLRTFYKYLRKQEIIGNDPMQKINALKAKKRLPDFVKEEEIMKLLDENIFEDTFEGWRDRLVIELFYATGIRLSELIHLKEPDIDIGNQTIKVLGKRNKERVIPFPKSIVYTIETYRKMRDREIEAAKDHGYLFVTRKGDPCYPVLIYRIVKSYLNRFVTAEKRSPHVLRHTYATHLLNKGAEINAVKDLLGHSSLAATQIYTHNTVAKLKKIYEQAHPKA